MSGLSLGGLSLVSWGSDIAQAFEPEESATQVLLPSIGIQDLSWTNHNHPSYNGTGVINDWSAMTALLRRFIDNQDGRRRCVWCFLALIGCRSIQLHPEVFWSVAVDDTPGKSKMKYEFRLISVCELVRRCQATIDRLSPCLCLCPALSVSLSLSPYFLVSLWLENMHVHTDMWPHTRKWHLDNCNWFRCLNNFKMQSQQRVENKHRSIKC